MKTTATKNTAIKNANASARRISSAATKKAAPPPRTRKATTALASVPGVTGAVLTAPVSMIGFDTSGSIDTAANAAYLASCGYKFAIRYVLCQGGLAVKPLTSAEASRLRAAGLAIGLIQAIPNPANITAANGTRDGAYAASQAKTLGYPPGCVLWFDFEGGSFPFDNVLIAYLNNWCLAVQGAGYPAGLYNGPQNALNGQQIMQLIFPHYWKADSITNDPSRGYQIKQITGTTNVPGSGTAIDVDMVFMDSKGDLPTMWAAQAA